MRVSRFIGMAVIVSGLALSVWAQQAPAIKKMPIKSVSPASGVQMFNNYCATCHGTDGRGDGPAAAALKTAPADLTQLAKQNNGKFPAMKVAAAIRGEGAPTAHGTKEMPVWGPLFRSISSGHESEVEQRVSNLTKYIEGLQAK